MSDVTRLGPSQLAAGNGMPPEGITLETSPGTAQSKRADLQEAPSLVRARGELAVRAYREFLDDPARSPGTRKVYRYRAFAFFRWAESRGLVLEAIDVSALAAYADEITAIKSRHEAIIVGAHAPNLLYSKGVVTVYEPHAADP